MSIFHVSIQLRANPHWYDYLHDITLYSDGSATLMDGGGHRFNGKARGQFAIHDTGPGTAEIHFTHLEEIDPFTREKIGELDDIVTQITRETGPFLLREEAFRIKDPNKQPCLVYRERFVFNSDPFDFAREQQKYNLYHLIEKRDFVNSVRIYYPMGDKNRYRYGTLYAMGFDVDKVMYR